MHEDIEIGEIGKRASSWLKENIEPHRFSPDRRWLSIAILSSMLMFTYIGFTIPEPSYSQFCAERTMAPAKSFTSPADTFKYALCRADDSISQQAVSYVMHPIYFTARCFFLFLAAIMGMHFLRKEKKDMLMQGVLYAIAFFFWALASVIYASVYTGWF